MPDKAPNVATSYILLNADIDKQHYYLYIFDDPVTGNAIFYEPFRTQLTMNYFEIEDMDTA